MPLSSFSTHCFRLSGKSVSFHMYIPSKAKSIPVLSHTKRGYVKNLPIIFILSENLTDFKSSFRTIYVLLLWWNWKSYISIELHNLFMYNMPVRSSSFLTDTDWTPCIKYPEEVFLWVPWRQPFLCWRQCQKMPESKFSNLHSIFSPPENRQIPLSRSIQTRFFQIWPNPAGK